MKKILLAGVTGLVLAGSITAYAHERGHWHHQTRMAPEDRAAFLDARIAAVHAGLRLNADQEKLWPPLESAVRDFMKLRTDRANARMAAREDRMRGADARGGDPVERLRQRAEAMGDNAAALKKIADAADPLYKTLDDGQKRRLAVLTRLEGRRGFAMEGRRGGWRADDRDDRPGFRRGEPDREFRRGGDRERDEPRGPSRL